MKHFIYRITKLLMFLILIMFFKPTNVFILGSTEQVVISHLMSPSEFYVYRKSNAADLNNLSTQFKTYVTVRENVPTHVEIGMC